MTCNSDVVGNALYGNLSSNTFDGVVAPTPLSNDALSTLSLDGTGTFDVLMRAYKLHLEEEYNEGRITGDQYTKAYIALTTSAMQNSVAFVTSRDTAYWAALVSQAQVKSEEGRLAQLKLQLSLADIEYCIKEQEKAQAIFTTTSIQPEQLINAERQNELLEEQIATALYQHSELLPTQKKLLLEQVEAKRAETMDTRTDGTTAIAGSVGKQKDLYTQQIDSYQKDATYKVAKLYSDAFIAQKTLDEGLLAPNEYTNAEVDQVLAHARSNVGIPT